MPQLKPPQQLKPSAPPRAQLPKSLPPPRPVAQAASLSVGVPPRVAPPSASPPKKSLASVPPPRAQAVRVNAPNSSSATSVPPPNAPAQVSVPKIPPPGALPAPGSLSGAPASAKAVQQFYVTVNDEVQTFDLPGIQRELDAGRFKRETLICEVGASKWTSISDANNLRLRLPELSSSAHVLESDLVTEEAPDVAPLDQVQPAPPSAGRQKMPWRTKLVVATWALFAIACLMLIFQRNGGLYSAANWMGFAEGYEETERNLLGGPGEHTVRGAERLWTKAGHGENLTQGEQE